MSTSFPDGALDAALRLYRATMPGIGGVVLADPDGTPLRHDLPTAHDASAAAHDAFARRTTGASALVPIAGRLALVVFMPGVPAPTPAPLAAI